MNDRVVAVIPARYASTRFPGKPLADIGGRPMIAHVIDRVRMAASVQEVIVATDDDRIARAVRACDCSAVMTSTSLRSGTDRVAEAVRQRADVTIVVNVQGDEPLLPPTMIDQAVHLVQEDPAVHAGTLVQRVVDPADLDNPSVVKVVLGADGRCLYFSRSPIPHVRGVTGDGRMNHCSYYRHVGLYVFRREFLLRYAALDQTPLEIVENLEQLRILEHGYVIKAAITGLESVAVDTPEDLEKVRTLFGPRFSH